MMIEWLMVILMIAEKNFEQIDNGAILNTLSTEK